jgi:hypothetical protein
VAVRFVDIGGIDDHYCLNSFLKKGIGCFVEEITKKDRIPARRKNFKNKIPGRQKEQNE